MTDRARRRLPLLLAALAAVGAVACGRSAPEPERAALSFVEAYYVRADLAAAARMAVGAAREKIEAQTRLRAAPGDRGAASAAPGLSGQRNVEYKVLEVRERPDGGKVYRIALTVSSAPMTLDIQTLVTVAERGGRDRRRWAVLNFLDLDASSPRRSRE